MAVVTKEIDVDIDLDDFRDEDLIAELEARGYEVNEETITETIETDIRGAEIKANGQTYKLGGMVKIIVGGGLNEKIC